MKKMGQQYLFQLSILPFQRNIRSDFISLFIQAAILKLINIIFTFQILTNIFRCYQNIDSFQWFQSLILFKNLHLKIMVKAQRFIYHLPIQVVEFISVIFQITNNKTVSMFRKMREEKDLLLQGAILMKRYQTYLKASYLIDRKSTRLNSSHSDRSRMPSSA